MKDESASVPIKEFFGLRSKIYSFITDENKGGKLQRVFKRTL